MTTLITKRKKFQRAFIACAAFGLAGLLLAACEREEETALGQAEQPDECEITGQAMSRKIALPAGSFTMGAHPVYGEEGPPHIVKVSAFEIDATEVTNAEFAKFVEATGYITDAERPQPGFEQPGGVVSARPRLKTRVGGILWKEQIGATLRDPKAPRDQARMSRWCKCLSMMRVPMPLGLNAACPTKPNGNMPQMPAPRHNMSGVKSVRPRGQRWQTHGRAHFLSRTR